MTDSAVISPGLPSVLPAHPRLHIPASAFDQLTTLRDDPWFTPYLHATAAIADEALDPDRCLASFIEEGHNWHLLRARRMQTMAWSLAIQARITGENRYVRAAMRCVQIMHDWEYWSWIAWRENNSDPLAVYDLSYGENAATLAVIHDWLFDHLTPQDITLIVACARRPLNAFLHFVDDQRRPSQVEKPGWVGHVSSNWNAVCTGGVGMLALTLAEHLPEASRIIALVEESLRPYMEHLVLLDGAWPEGIGYWNYGMRYAFLYLLSHERTTGQPHWAIEQPATRKSLHFPVDFTPQGVPCSFGDVNNWMPLPFHHLVAQRVGDTSLASRLFELHQLATPQTAVNDHWPNAAEALVCIRRPAAAEQSPASPLTLKLYNGLDWALLSAPAAKPPLAVTIRGGSTHWPHAHLDLTSFHVAAGGEHLVFNAGINEYLDSTFTTRRFELYDTTPPSKNVLLVNGLGITHPSCVTTRLIQLAPDLSGIHLDVTSALGQSRGGPAALQYSRLFLLIDERALLVLDHINLPHEGRCESRLHTPMTPTREDDAIHLQGVTQVARIHLACSEPARLHVAQAMPTTPASPLHVLRWITHKLHTRIAMASLIVPGKAPARIAVTTPGQMVRVQITLDGRAYDWQFNADLKQLHHDHP